MAQRRAVFDPNVLISAFIAPKGYSAKLRVARLAGRFELIVSPILLNELEGVL
jgi:predicted nucleic acid-binding protein